MRRRKVTYPPPKTSRKKGPALGPGTTDPRDPAARTVTINLAATTGRPSIKSGDRVRILSGLYAGEIATVESVVGGVIPAAIVRTEAGRTRRSRTIDLEPDRSATAPKTPASEGIVEV